MSTPLQSNGRRQRWLRSTTGAVAILATALFVAACGGDDDGGGDGDGGDGGNSRSASAISPFEPAASDWSVQGGDASYTYHSTLDEVDTTTVANLKGDFKVDLESGIEAKYSHEENVNAIDGNLYVSTGENDVIAYSGTDGEELWRHEGDLDPDISTVCCGWESRGLGFDGEDTLYSGRIDGKVQALDIETGDVKWETQVVDWKKDNATIIAAPRYYDGRVYVGHSGSEFQTRGRLVALDAETGKEDWTWWATGDTEGDEHAKAAAATWGDNDAHLTGSGSIWHAPAVDEEQNLLIFGTSTSSPDVNGANRPGDNLYTNSIVAIDAETGEYKWHFQVRKHDIWDDNQSTPVVLFDAEVNGETIPAAAVAGKTPWITAVDRRDGKPIYPGKEMPVSQSKENNTAATQWIPDNDALIPMEITDAEYAAIEQQIRASTAIKNAKTIEINRPEDGNKAELVFPAHDSTRATVMLGTPSGGNVWANTSYSPEEQLLISCGQKSVGWAAKGEDAGFVEGTVSIGGGLGTTGFNNAGYVTAVKASTHEQVWTYETNAEDGTPNSCYSGTVTTAGGVVFVGKNDGKFVALDVKTGKELWSFQTGASVNAPATVFEADGVQKIAVVAGGNSLAGTTHGDNLWVFSLEGDMEELPGLETGDTEAQEHAGQESSDEDAEESDAEQEAEGTEADDAAGDAASDDKD